MNARLKISRLQDSWLRLVYATLALTLCFVVPVSAQQSKIRFERISMERGLSQSIVRVIFQDHQGFLWFGTQDGLNKFDGYEFTVYKYNPADTTSLSDNDIWAIYEAPSEPAALWIGTSTGGLNRFDRETETFTRFRHDPNDSASLSHNFVGNLHEDLAGNLWILTGAGLDRIDRKTGTFTHYRHHPGDPNSLGHNRITSFVESPAEPGILWFGTPRGVSRFDTKTQGFTNYRREASNGNGLEFDFILALHQSPNEPGVLWIGTGDPDNLIEGGGLNRFDAATGTFTHYLHEPSDPASISSNVVTVIHEGKDGTLWIGTAAGLDRFDKKTGAFSHYQPNPGNPSVVSNVVASIIEDSRGALWIRTAARDGVHRFDPHTGIFTHCRFDPIDPHSLSNDIVYSIYEDRSGVLWFGTEVGGLSRVDHFAQKFQTYAPEPNNIHSLSNYLVRAISEDRFGTLWVGVLEGGLNELDRKTGRFKHHRHDPQRPASLSSDNVWVVHEDRAGTLWVGTLGGGLNKFDRRSASFKHYRHHRGNRNSLSNDNIRVIYEDRTTPGILWIGTDGGGINRFDVQTEHFIRYHNDPDDPHSLSNNFVRAIHQDQNGIIWLGTAGGGLNKFDPQSKTFTRYQNDPTNPTSLGGNTVQSIYEDPQGILWLGTYGAGLNRFDPMTEQFTVFTERNSDLCNNVVYATLPDAQGNLWLSTNAGVSKFNPQTKTFKSYDVDDGLQSREFNGQAFFKNRAGEMFFGGISGFNVFHPDSVRDNPNIPQLAITDFKIFNESIPIGGDSPLRKHISQTDSITLSHEQNDISFDFVALHYGRPENNQYAYMLENYDQAWWQAGTKRTATYTNLDPGKYIFRVKGSNNDGVWNEEGIALRITITPPWWRTRTASVLFAVLLIAAIATIERLHRTRVLKKEREKAQIREAELRAETAEAKARAIQAENERKTHELEEARKLQLSMLPKSVPTLPHLDVAVYTQTANEVGGDYYDFKLHADGTLTAAIGDATGHGLQAGTMVAATKSLFNSLAHMPEPAPILSEASHALKEMGFHNMYMAMTVAKFKDRKLQLAAAGMPYTLVYRTNSSRVEEIELKSMPLGTFSDISYPSRELGLDPGDTVLFMSDGLLERFNREGEVLGEERVKTTFSEVGPRSPKQIIEHLVNAGKSWAKGEPQNDDVTLVVVKMK